MAKGNCYEANGKKILFDANFKDCKLIHGVVINSCDGEPMGHCWLERGDIVFDFSRGASINEIPKELYYEMGGIPVKGFKKFEYSLDEARAKIVEFEHWGCWDSKTIR